MMVRAQCKMFDEGLDESRELVTMPDTIRRSRRNEEVCARRLDKANVSLSNREIIL